MCLGWLAVCALMGRGWGEEWRRSALQGCTALEMFFFPFAPVDSPSTVSIFRGDARCFSSTTWHASTVALNCTVLDYNVADSPPSTDRTVAGLRGRAPAWPHAAVAVAAGCSGCTLSLPPPPAPRTLTPLTPLTPLTTPSTRAQTRRDWRPAVHEAVTASPPDVAPGREA